MECVCFESNDYYIKERPPNARWLSVGLISGSASPSRFGKYVWSNGASVDPGIAFRIFGKDLECPHRMAIGPVDSTENSVASPFSRLVGLENVNQKVDDLMVFGSPYPAFEIELAGAGVFLFT